MKAIRHSGINIQIESHSFELFTVTKQQSEHCIECVYGCIFNCVPLTSSTFQLFHHYCTCAARLLRFFSIFISKRAWYMIWWKENSNSISYLMINWIGKESIVEVVEESQSFNYKREKIAGCMWSYQYAGTN